MRLMCCTPDGGDIIGSRCCEWLDCVFTLYVVFWAALVCDVDLDDDDVGAPDSSSIVVVLLLAFISLGARSKASPQSINHSLSVMNVLLYLWWCMYTVQITHR